MQHDLSTDERNESMSATEVTNRVLIVDDNRDGADALGLLVEELGNHVHVTYSGLQALDVATAFEPDLILVDLVMPGMGGCDLVMRLRQIQALNRTKIVAITGLKDVDNTTAAKRAGCDNVLSKPVALTDIKTALADLVVTGSGGKPKRTRIRANVGSVLRLPIEDARRIRNERPSRTLTQVESEAAICDGVIRFQEEYLGWKSNQIQIHILKDLLVVRICDALTLAERQLAKSSVPGIGRDLIKQTRKQLLRLARPMLESLVHEVCGVKVLSMHHDISTVTGEEMVIFTLAEIPRFE